MKKKRRKPGRPSLRGKKMDERLTISLPNGMQKRLKEFAGRSSMSVATAGRMAIEFLITVSENGVVPTGDKGTINYMLQQMPDLRARREQAQRKGES